MAGLLHREDASICMLSKERLGLPRSLSRWRDAKDTAGPVDVATMRRRVRAGGASSALPWQLVGVHSTRMDMRTRDRVEDESRGLNCAWYADVLVPLTA